MTPIKRPLAAAGAAALLGLSLSACGGSGPTDASKDDFCAAVKKLDDPDSDVEKAVKDEDWDAIADAIHDQVDEIKDVGTPEDISDDARKGWEQGLDKAKDISADDIEKAFKDNENPFDDDLSGDEKKYEEAYQEYESKTCSESSSSPDSTDGSEGTEPPTDMSSDLPSGMPSDLPSGMPSDLPSDLSDIPTDLGTGLPDDLQSQLDDLEDQLSGLPTQ